MIPAISKSSIEIKEISPDKRLIFKYIGQIIKAYVQKKISKELYLVRFFKSAVLVKSNIDLNEGEQIFLRVESLGPKIVLKKVSVQKAKDSDKGFSVFNEISRIEQKYPHLRVLLDLISKPENIRKRLFWENLKDLFLSLKKNGSSEYLSFIKSINQNLEGIYIQLPFFCFSKPTEIFFSFKGSKKKEEKYIIHIRVELSLIGTVDVFIEDAPAYMNIMFGVSDKEIQKFFMKQIHFLHDILERDCSTKKISLDCRILPREYLKVPLSSIVKKGKGVNLFV